MLWTIIRDRKNAVEGKGLRVNVDKNKRYAVIIWEEK